MFGSDGDDGEREGAAIWMETEWIDVMERQELGLKFKWSLVQPSSLKLISDCLNQS